jgi:hypothetical protein
MASNNSLVDPTRMKEEVLQRNLRVSSLPTVGGRHG